MQTQLPQGTATGNADAVRQSQIGQAFYLFADIISGADDQPRMAPGETTRDGLLGPSASFGIDVGVAADGTLYARGRSGTSADNRAVPAGGKNTGRAATDTADALTMSPLVLIALAGLALKFIL